MNGEEKVERMYFENMDAWKRSAVLSCDIYKQFSSCKDFGFKDQITRSGLSIPSNIAEGLERDTNKDSLRFMYFAKGSVAELITQTYIGIKIGYIPNDIGQSWIKECRFIAKLIGGIIRKKKIVNP